MSADREFGLDRATITAIAVRPNGTVLVATTAGVVYENVLLDYPNHEGKRHVWLALAAGFVPGTRG